MKEIRAPLQGERVFLARKWNKNSMQPKGKKAWASWASWLKSYPGQRFGALSAFPQEVATLDAAAMWYMAAIDAQLKAKSFGSGKFPWWTLQDVKAANVLRKKMWAAYQEEK